MQVTSNVHYLGKTEGAKAAQKPPVLEQLQAAAITPESEIILKSKDSFTKTVSVKEFLADPDAFKMSKGKAFLSVQVGGETVVIDLKKLTKKDLLAALTSSLGKVDKLEREGMAPQEVQKAFSSLVDQIRRPAQSAKKEMSIPEKLMINQEFSSMAPERQASLAKLFVDFGLNDTALSLISDLAKNKDLSKSFFGALEAVGNDQAHAGRVLALFQTLLENANKGTISPEKIKEIANTKPQQILGKNEFGQLEALLYKQAQGPKGGKTEAIDKLLHVAAERTRREPFVQVHLDDLKAPPRTFVKVMSMVRDNVMGPEIFEMASRCQDKKELLHNIARYEAVDHAYNSKKLDLNLVKTLAHMPLSEKAEKELFKLLSHPDPAQLAAFVKKEESKVVNIF